MISLLNCFDYLGRVGDTIITCLIAITVVICIVMICKNEGSRKVFAYILGTVVIIAGIFSSIGLHKEITARSYVNGKIDIENQFIARSFNYSSTSLVLYHDTYDDTNTYKFDIELLPVQDFNGLTKKYEITLNEYYILNAKIDAGSVQFNYIVDFYDTQNTVLCSGTLNVAIAFYSDRTQLTVSTVGSEQSQYFEQYAKDNGFRLKIAEKQAGGNDEN